MPIQPFRASSPAAKHHSRASTGHVVQFYEDEDFLAELVVDFLSEGLAAGQPAIVIATEPHVRRFTEGLRVEGLDVDAASQGGLLTMLDARKTLDSFMAGAVPDQQRFLRIVGRAFETACAGRPGRSVRAYGEMVNVLWKDGNPEAAIRLERCWNTLLKAYDCSLMCAFGMRNGNDADGSAVRLKPNPTALND